MAPGFRLIVPRWSCAIGRYRPTIASARSGHARGSRRRLAQHRGRRGFHAHGLFQINTAKNARATRCFLRSRLLDFYRVAILRFGLQCNRSGFRLSHFSLNLCRFALLISLYRLAPLAWRFNLRRDFRGQSLSRRRSGFNRFTRRSFSRFFGDFGGRCGHVGRGNLGPTNAAANHIRAHSTLDDGLPRFGTSLALLFGLDDTVGDNFFLANMDLRSFLRN